MPGVRSAVERLEQQFAVWLGVQGAIATGYGRGALWLALQLVIGGKPGAEVLVPDFICAQVPEAVRRAGGRPVPFPVQRDLTVRPQDVEAAITRGTRAVILAHYYGRALPHIRILAEVCRRRSIVVIEECALALGTRAQGQLAGRFGDLAVFSFTKSDWCYGGGMLATPVRDWVERLRSLREEKCRPAARLAFCYGLLRRLDSAANRPAWSRLAGCAGRWLEKGLSAVEPSLAGNFFDAGRFDATMPPFAARRAQRILARLDATIARRRASLPALVERFRKEVAFEDDTFRPFRDSSNAEADDTAAFLLLEAPAGKSSQCAARADAAGFTWRLPWPAYQQLSASSGSEHIAWLKDHLLIIENHR